MVVIPADNAVTDPLAEPTEATDGELLLQVPPAAAFVSVVTSPTHILAGPEIVAGSGFTVTSWVTKPVAPRL
jgi:hypothetical protein